MQRRSPAGTASDENDSIRGKLMRVFRFLQALDQLRNPVRRDIQEQPWVLWWRDLPQHPCIELGVVEPPSPGESEVEESAPGMGGDSFILRVKRPTITRAPEPPEAIREWLEPGWEGIHGPVRTVETRAVSGAEGVTREIRFSEDSRRPSQLATYLQQWEKWAGAERPARATLTVFERLYALHAQLQREGEGYELVIGDGLLTWRHRTGFVHHPVLLQRLRLDFDPLVPEFTLSDAIQSPELYSALFRTMPDINAVAVGQSRTELEQRGWHPLGGDETDDFLKRLVVVLHARGQFTGKGEPPTEKEFPQIGRTPVLFLRRRTLGFSAALEGILEQLPTRADLPPALSRTVGIDPSREVAKESSGTPSWEASPNGEDEEVLLSKPANPEQLAIARRLEEHGAVLVQGPPGTGKTHTIGNLIGHLLAQGKSILVTSHTAKALKVLRDQVVEPLRPLCVSVLDDSTHQLESAVDTITDRLSALNADQLEREAALLHRSRLRVLAELRKARAALQQARQDEYRPLVLAGEEYRPSQASRWVAEHEAEHDWIPAPLARDAILPLTTADLIELYATNSAITDADESELNWTLPDPAGLVAPTEFRRSVTELTGLTKNNALNFRSDLWGGNAGNDNGDELLGLSEQLKQGLEPLVTGPRWWLSAALAGKEGDQHRKVWDDLIAQIETAYTQAAEAHVLLLKHGPELPTDCPPGKAEEVVNEIVRHLQEGGRLSWWALMRNGDWKVLVGKARVNGRSPESLEHFQALKAHLRLQSTREDLVRRWQRQMTPLGAPDTAVLGPEPEGTCRQYVAAIRTALDWNHATWVPLQRTLIGQGFRWEPFITEVPPTLAEFGDILRLREAVTERLPAVVDAEILRRRHRWWQEQFKELHRRLDLAGRTGAGVVKRLQDAVKGKDPDEYARAFERLVDLRRRGQALVRRRELLSKLDPPAPAWTEHLRRRAGVHGGSDLPGDPVQAWKWRQLQDELERRSQTSMEELQAQIDQLSGQLRDITTQLVEKRAWAAQVRRTSLTQRMALGGWKQIMSKIGKGTGKRVPRLQAEAKRLMPECQTAVPVWIMPLSRVVENYDPRTTRFDVLIIDEASQSDLMALIAVFMAKQVVVVGDHEQVSPLAVGQRVDEVQHLIDEHLEGIPNAILYDGRYSIYEVAQNAFEPICLREHFRCVRPIIEYSNHLSYEGKIKPLRDASSIQRRPHTVAYRVEATTTDGGSNEDEATTVASLMIAATEQPEYQEATFGAISMVGDDQARRIDQLLQRHMSPEEYQRRKVQCGNSAEFQGDERDVVFLSMVDTPVESGPLSLRTDGPEKMYKKRFNVAASRARDQMWVVYSLNPETDLQPADIRRGLIEHAKDPLALVRTLEHAESQVESEFERLVIRRLIEAGYRVTPQQQVGAYRIDMVVEGGGKQLAVECDGERWHTPEKLAEDMARQAILERLGWRFIRLRGSEFFRNPGKAMARVFARLKSLGIPEEGHGETNRAMEVEQELLERVKRRAGELRNQWLEEGEIPAARTRRRFNRAAAGPAEAVPEKTRPQRQASASKAPREAAGQLNILDLLEENGEASSPDLGQSRPSKEAEPILQPTVAGPAAAVGSTVVLENRVTGERLSFVLTESHKANIDEGRISVDSPVGRAALGRRSGQIAYVAAPEGVMEYMVLAVQS